MFSVTGKIINIFDTPAGKDKKTGADYSASCKIQLLGELQLKTGATKNELLTLNIPAGKEQEFRDQVGCDVVIPVGVFVSGGRVQAFIPS